MLRLLPVVAVVALCGCRGAVRVRPMDPRPNIDLPRSGLALGLDLAAVPDQFVVPEKQGVTEVPVEDWRASVQAGFDNGLAPFYAQKAKPDVWLRFLKVDLEYTPVAIYVNGGGAAAVKARITYMAQLVDGEGRVLARMKGEALSRNPWTTWGGSTSTAEEALAAMYEDIADRGLRTLDTAVPAAAPAATGQSCGPGELLHQGRCISACNPPCPRDEQCTNAGQCVKSNVTQF